MYTVYILFSNTLQKYYVGFTSMSMEERLSRHLCGHGGYTSKAKDWKIVYTEMLEDKSQVLIKEKQIKKRGAGRYIQDQNNS